MSCISFIRANGLGVLSLSLLSGSAIGSEPPNSVVRHADSESSAVSIEEVAQGLETLASEALNNVPVPTSWGGSVKYYRGISHSFHRIMVHGHSYGMTDEVPPSRSYHAFYYDTQGYLQFIAFHPPEGEAYVTDKILYRQRQPTVRASYSTEGLSYIDYVHYREVSPVVSCRMLRDGTIVLLKRLGDHSS